MEPPILFQHPMRAFGVSWPKAPTEHTARRDRGMRCLRLTVRRMECIYKPTVFAQLILGTHLVVQGSGQSCCAALGSHEIAPLHAPKRVFNRCEHTEVPIACHFMPATTVLTSLLWSATSSSVYLPRSACALPVMKSAEVQLLHSRS